MLLIFIYVRYLPFDYILALPVLEPCGPLGVGDDLSVFPTGHGVLTTVGVGVILLSTVPVLTPVAAVPLLPTINWHC